MTVALLAIWVAWIALSMLGLHACDWWERRR